MLDLNFYYPTLTAPYKSWPDKTLVSGSHYIFTSMNGNDNFTTIATQVANYGETSDLFRDQVAIAANRDKNAIIAKDITRLTLIGATLNLSNAVMQIANGDLQILASSGMELRKRAQPIVIAPPQNLIITASTVAEQLKTKVDAVKGAKSYIVKYTIDPQTPTSQWETIVCTTRQCELNGLQSGAKYWIMVGAVGGNDQTEWGVAQISPFVP